MGSEATKKRRGRPPGTTDTKPRKTPEPGQGRKPINPDGELTKPRTFHVTDREHAELKRILQGWRDADKVKAEDMIV